MSAADPLTRRAAILAGFVCGDPEAGWPLLHRAMDEEPRLAKEALLRLCDSDHLGWQAALSPQDLAKLFCFMEKHFPATPSSYGRGTLPEPIWFRDRIPQWIAEMGTEEAVHVLDDLAERFPEQQEMWAQYRQHARRRLRENIYRPPKPADLLRLEQDARTRFVRSDAELAELVLESLERLQDELQGTKGGTPLARALWNESGENGWRPKDENFLSDYVKQHLQTDLLERRIVANREVELRAARSGEGQRTDILVEAVQKRSSGDEGEPVAAVVIEVKGCWNKDIRKSMESQLRDRYLEDHGYRCGIYLVGWFVCDRWPGASMAMRKPGPEDTIEAWRGELARQAEELSVNGFALWAFVLDARIGPAS